MCGMTGRAEDAEWLEVIGADGGSRGRKRRGAVHRDGDWHRVFHCWVAGMGEGGPFVLLQRRGAAKDVHPGRLDVSCAGHLAAGESDAGGVRELAEELGVAVRFEQLAPLGVVPEVAHASGIVDREVCATFLLASAAPLEAYAPDAGEVAGLVRASLSGARALAAGLREDLPAVELVAASRAVRAVTIRRDELVPRPPGRYAWALDAIAAIL
jgi:isopentenyldiphosphate isomerase